MTEGIRAPNLPLGASIGEFLGHEIVGGKRSVRRFPRSSVMGQFDSVLSAGGGVVFSTKALADASLAYPANQMAWVVTDSDTAKNGVYQKSGASGSGSWVRLTDLPNEIISIEVTGGTANAIEGAVFPQVPTSPQNKLYLLTPTVANTDAVTLTIPGFAGGVPIPVKNAFGSTLAANSFLPDSQVLMAWMGGIFQLLISANVDASSILADAVAARDTASSSATAAQAAASALGNQVHQYDTRALAEADTIPAGVNLVRTFGDASAGDGHNRLYKKVVSEPTHADKFQSVDGAWWEEVPAIRVDTAINAIATTRFSTDQVSIRSAGFALGEVAPLETTWRRRAAPTVAKPWHRQSADGQWWEISDRAVHPFMFGAKGDDYEGFTADGTDDSDAFLACFEMLNNFAADRDITGKPFVGDMVIPPGNYFVDAQINGFDPWGWRNTRIVGYGATIRPGSSLGINAPIRIGRGSNNYGVTIEGLNVDLTKSSQTCQYAIELSGSANTTLRKVAVGGGGTVGNGGIYIHQSDQNDPDTGAFWVTIDDCWIRQNAANNMTYSIFSEGSNNNLIIHNTKMSPGQDSGVCVLIADNTGATPYVANSVQMLRCALEGATYGLWFDIDDRPFGLRSIGNRFEHLTYAHRFRQIGTPVANTAVPIIGENIYIGVTTNVLNPDGTVLDMRD